MIKQRVFHISGLILPFFLLLGIFLFNMRDSHDWGGDFSMYIIQAKQTCNGDLGSPTGYVINPNYNDLAPSHYPPLYSFYLTPFYCLCGNNMQIFIIANSLLVLVWGLLIYMFLKQYTRKFLAILVCLILVYNPHLLNFKAQILSDVLFAVMTFGLILSYQQNRPWFYKMLWLTVCILTRTAGIAFLPAAIIVGGTKMFRSRATLSPIQIATEIAIPAIPVMVYWIMNSFWTESSNTYLQFVNLQQMWNVFHLNYDYYYEILKHWMNLPTSFGWIPATLQVVVPILALIGFTGRIRKGFAFHDWLFVCYVLMLLFYDYRHAGFRFTLPVMPVLALYALTGATWVYRFIRIVPKLVFNIIFPVMFLLLYINSWADIRENGHYTLPGPQEPTSIEFWEYAKTNIPPNTLTVFVKPRVFALYTDRKSISPHKDIAVANMDHLMATYHPQFLLTQSDLWSPAIDQYIEEYPHKVKLVFENEKFRLYRNMDSE